MNQTDEVKQPSFFNDDYKVYKQDYLLFTLYLGCFLIRQQQDNIV